MKWRISDKIDYQFKVDLTSDDSCEEIFFDSIAHLDDAIETDQKFKISWEGTESEMTWIWSEMKQFMFELKKVMLGWQQS